MNPLLGNQYHYNDDKQGFVSVKHERLAEIVHDYDPELDLVFIKTQVPPDPQYAVIHWRGEKYYQVVSWWQEHELDDRVLIHLFENDFRKHSPDEIFNQVEARNLAQKLMLQREQEDRAAEEREFMVSVLKSPLNVYRHKGREYRG